MAKTPEWTVSSTQVDTPDAETRRARITRILLNAAARQKGEEERPLHEERFLPASLPRPRAKTKPARKPKTPKVESKDYRDYLGPEVPVLFDWSGEPVAWGHRPEWMPDDAFAEMKLCEEVRYVEGKYPFHSRGHYVVIKRRKEERR